MSKPVDIKSSQPGTTTDENELLDHRNQPQSLPRNGRSASVSFSAGSPTLMRNVSNANPPPNSFEQLHHNLDHETRQANMTRFSEASNEFAIEDDLEFDALEDSVDLGGNSRRSQVPAARPRAGSHLDAVLSAPIRPSPRPGLETRGRPPSLILDASQARSRTSSTSSTRSKRLPLFSTRTRRMSGQNRALEKEQDDRISIDAPSHPPSQHGEEEEAEQDVCFPMSEEVRSAEGVDFDELDAFVVEQETAMRATNTRSTRKMSHLSSKTEVNLAEKEDLGFSSSSSGEYSSSDPSYAASREYSSRFASPAILPNKMQHLHVPEIEKSSAGVGAGPLLSKATSMPRPLTSLHLRQMELSADAPDRFSFFTSERDDTIHARDLGGLLNNPDASFKELFRQDRGCWWLDVMCPSDAEMKTIAKAFGIHPLTAEDIRVQETREKVELFKSYYFVCFRSFDHDKESKEFLEPVNLYVVVFKEGLLSFHFAPTSHPANVRRRIRQLRDYVSVSADWISYAIIDDVTDVFMPFIHEIEDETDAIEDAVMITRENDTPDMLRRIGECRKKVMALFRLLHGKADVIKMFAKRCNEQWDVAPKGEIGLYLGDIQDHLVTMTSSLTQFEKILSRSHSNYLAQLSVYSMDSANRLNATLGKITFIATMLVPMNLLTGLWGMNVNVPGKDTGGLYWFFGIVGFICLFFITAYIVSQKSKIGRNLGAR